MQFREAFIERHWDGEIPPACRTCGTEERSTLRVHHRRYDDREPWEYPDEDLLLVCKPCHDEIHALERKARAFVIALHPHECHEFELLLSALIDARESGMVKVAIARCKRAAQTTAEEARE